MLTFVELPPFDIVRDRLFSDEEFDELLQHLMDDSECGVVVPGTGGCRKVRWVARAVEWGQVLH